MIKVMDDNFPERLHVCYVVRAPWIFNAMYKVVSPMLAADTKAKVKILGASMQLPENFRKLDLDTTSSVNINYDYRFWTLSPAFPSAMPLSLPPSLSFHTPTTHTTHTHTHIHAPHPPTHPLTHLCFFWFYMFIGVSMFIAC